MIVQDSFENYIQSVDALYDSKRELYAAFSLPDDPIRASFFTGFMYILEKALASNEDGVFIKVPSFNMGRATNNHEENEKWFLSAIRSTLLYATTDECNKLLDCNDLDEGDLLFVYKRIRDNWREGIYDEPRFFRIEKRTNGALRAIEYSDENTHRPYRSKKIFEKYFPRKEDLEAFKQYTNDSIRLNASPSGRWTSTVDKLLTAVNDIKSHKHRASTYPKYGKVAVVGLGKHASGILPFDGCPLESPIIFTDDFDKIRTDKSIELLIFIDNKHTNKIDSVRDKLNKSTDGLRKVVIIGQECAGPFSVYPYSVREWFHYFIGDKYYPTIIEKHISFPWLKERISELRGILESDDTLPQEAKATIIHRILYPFMSSDFCGVNINQEKELDEISSIIEDAYAGEQNYDLIEDAILDWYSSLPPLESDNPKKQVINELSRGASQCLVIPRKRTAYKRAIGRFIQNKNSASNIIVFDGIRQARMEVFSNLLELCALGTYYFLFYDVSDIKHLREFVTSQNQLLFAPKRIQWLDGLKPIGTPIGNRSSQDIWNVEDTDVDMDLDGGLFDEIESTIWNARDGSYIVSFTDGESAVIQGHIIHNHSKIKIDTLAESEAIEGQVITYYDCPEQFSDLMTIYKNYPLGQDEDYYARLWITALKDLYNNVYAKNLDDLGKDLKGVKKALLKRYVSPSYTDHFPGSKLTLRRICSLLCEKRVITLEDMLRVRRAKDFRDENTSHGQKFKGELLDYRLKKRIIRGGFIDTIIENSRKRGDPISIEKIESFALHEKEIVSIKKNNDDNE